MSDSDFSVKRQLDALANEFEEQWSPDRRASIKPFIERIDEQYRAQLLRMLLDVDVELRIKSGQKVDATDYSELGEQAVAQVNDLLAEDADSTLSGSLSPDPHLTATASECPTNSSTSTIGPYRLLQQIGEGGMGTVWMADQQQPVKRRVALKLIRADMGNKEAIARFEAERQALAMMDHQNIAKVLDAGTTENGSPYFVMELVKGIPLTQYCDDNKLSIKERLDLFIPVCNAIQHAHQKGIIHRDLKPSNVLVTLYDGEAVPKVIDFGLAKALEHTTKLTDKTMFTEFGKVVGTLQYMAPEQAEINALDVDTRTDIYSLGVMLYELLTGSTPLDKDTLGKNALLRVLEIIRETEPPRPSHRLSSSGDAVTGISQQRKIAPAKLQQILRGELDWVVMKALEKDRSRRYESASGFADDVRRYLDQEPVLARPPSTGYRFRKFVRRNRTLVATTVGIFLLLAAGIFGTSWFAYQSNQQTKAANAARQQVVEANNTAVAQRDAARRRLDLAMDAIESFYTDISKDMMLKRPELVDLRTRLLSKPKDFLVQLQEELSDDDSLYARHKLGLAYYRLGFLYHLIGNDTEGQPYFERAVEVMDEVVREDPTHRRALFNWIVFMESCLEAERGAKGELSPEQAQVRNLRFVPEFKQAFEFLKALSTKTDNDDSVMLYQLICLNSLAMAEAHPRWIDPACEFAEKINILGIQDENDRMKATSIVSDVGWGVADRDPDTSLRILKKNQIAIEQLLKTLPARQKTSLRYNQAENLDRQIMVRRKVESSYDALDDYQRVFEIRKQIIEENPGNLQATEATARAAYSVARRYFERTELDNADDWVETAVGLLNSVLEKDALRFGSIGMIQMAHMLRGEIKLDLREYEEALVSFEATSNIDSYHGPPPGGSPYDVKRALAEAKLGKTKEAFQRVKNLTVKLSPEIKLTAARALSCCCPEIADQEHQDQCMQLALKFLKQALGESTGEQRQKLMEQLDDSDWKPLRNQEEFLQLVGSPTSAR